ncbi:MAG: amidohydrolase family protein, partial [Ginsengibacter sp.]
MATSERQKKYYSCEDFYTVRKMDAHVHLNTDEPSLPEQALADNFSLISINTKMPGFPTLNEQQYFILKQKASFPNVINYLTSFDSAEIALINNCDRQLDYIRESLNSGAIGVKIWKDIGMVIRDSEGRYLLPNDSILDPIFHYLQENKIAVCGHIGEPLNCWLPLGKMTTNNDRDYFRNHPEYHMYLHPECPSYDVLIAARDGLLEKYNTLRFTGAHLGSLEWSFYELSKRLDRFPNMTVDIAERLGQIQFQSIENWQAVHNFFVTYQDRIIYGTDIIAGENDKPDNVRVRAHELWMRDWKYFTTNEEM